MLRDKAGLVLQALLVCWLSQGHVFFWDTVQLSAKQALWFYENGFNSLLLPNELDSGHPPLMGIYLAAVWSLFGKSLAAAHWAMFPFIVGINFLLYSLIRLAVQSEKNIFWLLFLFWLDPVLAGQMFLVSPDLILVFGFLLVLHGFQTNRSGYVVIGVFVLSLISMRGMMTVFGLFLYEMWSNRPGNLSQLFRQSLKYVPGVGLSLAFLGWHYWQKGWIGYHGDSPWAPSFSGIGEAAGLFKNAIILLWRIVDFGRLFLLLGLGILWYRLPRTNALIRLFALPFFLALVFFPVVVGYAHLSAHRYFLPFFLSLTLVFIHLLGQLRFSAYAKKIAWLALTGLALGNLWVYPPAIAQGWDATLAHVPYYRLRQKMLEYMESEGIEPDSTGTAFPEIGPLDHRDLSEDKRGMLEKDLERQSFVFYANIMNDFTDEELAALREKWIPRKALGNWPVQVILYEKKK